jgi:hypothetical protein
MLMKKFYLVCLLSVVSISVFGQYYWLEAVVYTEFFTFVDVYYVDSESFGFNNQLSENYTLVHDSKAVTFNTLLPPSVGFESGRKLTYLINIILPKIQTTG